MAIIFLKFSCALGLRKWREFTGIKHRAGGHARWPICVESLVDEHKERCGRPSNLGRSMIRRQAPNLTRKRDAPARVYDPNNPRTPLRRTRRLDLMGRVSRRSPQPVASVASEKEKRLRGAFLFPMFRYVRRSLGDNPTSRKCHVACGISASTGRVRV